MPVFEIEANGKTFEVEAPDQQQALAAISGMPQQPAQQQGVLDKLTGVKGERYQTWPERLARSIASSVKSGVTLPGDVLAGDASPNDTARVMDLAGLSAPLNPAARIGDRALPGAKMALKTEKPIPPTAEALQSAARQGFEASKSMGVAFPPRVVQEMGRRIEVDLQNKGILPEHAPVAYQTLARLREAPEGASVTMSDIHNLRQAFGNAAGSVAPKDGLAGSMGVSAVDRLLQAVAEKGAVAGAAAPASKALKDAIGNSAAAFRSDAVTGRADMAALRAKVANSGQNLDNATRQRFVDIASEGKAARGFSDPEIAQALKIAEGGPVTNSARYAGNLLGGGGGLGMAVTGGLGAALGATTGGPVGAGIGAAVGPILGATMKKTANALTSREVRKLDELVRQRSPLFRDAMRDAPVTPVSPEMRAVLFRTLLLNQNSQ